MIFETDLVWKTIGFMVDFDWKMIIFVVLLIHFVVDSVDFMVDLHLKLTESTTKSMDKILKLIVFLTNSISNSTVFRTVTTIPDNGERTGLILVVCCKEVEHGGRVLKSALILYNQDKNCPSPIFISRTSSEANQAVEQSSCIVSTKIDQTCHALWEDGGWRRVQVITVWNNVWNSIE